MPGKRVLAGSPEDMRWLPSGEAAALYASQKAKNEGKEPKTPESKNEHALELPEEPQTETVPDEVVEAPEMTIPPIEEEDEPNEEPRAPDEDDDEEEEPDAQETPHEHEQPVTGTSAMAILSDDNSTEEQETTSATEVTPAKDGESEPETPLNEKGSVVP